MNIKFTKKEEIIDYRNIIKKIKKMFPEIQVNVSFDKEENKKAKKQKHYEYQQDIDYLKEKKEQEYNDVLNYYSNVKKIQEIYWYGGKNDRRKIKN